MLSKESITKYLFYLIGYTTCFLLLKVDIWVAILFLCVAWPCISIVLTRAGADK